MEIAPPNPDLVKMHQQLIKDHYDVPQDFAVFERNMQNPDVSVKVQSGLIKAGYDVPNNPDSFRKTLGLYQPSNDNLTDEDINMLKGGVQEIGDFTSHVPIEQPIDYSTLKTSAFRQQQAANIAKGRTGGVGNDGADMEVDGQILPSPQSQDIQVGGVPVIGALYDSNPLIQAAKGVKAGLNQVAQYFPAGPGSQISTLAEGVNELTDLPGDESPITGSKADAGLGEKLTGVTAGLGKIGFSAASIATPEMFAFTQGMALAGDAAHLNGTTGEIYDWVNALPQKLKENYYKGEKHPAWVDNLTELADTGWQFALFHYGGKGLKGVRDAVREGKQLSDMQIREVADAIKSATAEDLIKTHDEMVPGTVQKLQERQTGIAEDLQNPDVSDGTKQVLAQTNDALQQQISTKLGDHLNKIADDVQTNDKIDDLKETQQTLEADLEKVSSPAAKEAVLTQVEGVKNELADLLKNIKKPEVKTEEPTSAKTAQVEPVVEEKPIIKPQNTENHAVQEQNTATLHGSEQGETGQTGGEHKGVGESDQLQEPAGKGEAKEEEVTPEERNAKIRQNFTDAEDILKNKKTKNIDATVGGHSVHSNPGKFLPYEDSEGNKYIVDHLDNKFYPEDQFSAKEKEFLLERGNFEGEVNTTNPFEEWKTEDLHKRMAYFDQKIIDEKAKTEKRGGNKPLSGAGIDYLSDADKNQYSALQTEISKRERVSPEEAKARVEEKRNERLKDQGEKIAHQDNGIDDYQKRLNSGEPKEKIIKDYKEFKKPFESELSNENPKMAEKARQRVDYYDGLIEKTRRAQKSETPGEKYYPHPFVKKVEKAYLEAKNDFDREKTVRDMAWDLGGDSNKHLRQQIMTELKGKIIPVSKSGITALHEALVDWIKENNPEVKEEEAPSTKNVAEEKDMLDSLMDRKGEVKKYAYQFSKEKFKARIEKSIADGKNKWDVISKKDNLGRYVLYLKNADGKVLWSEWVTPSSKGDIWGKREIIEEGKDNLITNLRKESIKTALLETESKPISDFAKDISEGRMTNDDAVKIINSVGLEVPEAIKKLREAATDLKGDPQADWMKSLDDLHEKREPDFKRGDMVEQTVGDRKIKEDVTEETATGYIVDRNGSRVIIPKENTTILKDRGVSKSKYKTTIELALNKGDIRRAIEDGRISANDAINIIKHAGLEVPDHIKNLGKPLNIESNGKDETKAERETQGETRPLNEKTAESEPKQGVVRSLASVKEDIAGGKTKAEMIDTIEKELKETQAMLDEAKKAQKKQSTKEGNGKIVKLETLENKQKNLVKAVKKIEEGKATKEPMPEPKPGEPTSYKHYIIKEHGEGITPEFKVVKGEPVKLDMPGDFFVIKDAGETEVFEGKTGRVIARDYHYGEAVKEANKLIKDKGPEEINRIIQEYVDKTGISPRYTEVAKEPVKKAIAEKIANKAAEAAKHAEGEGVPLIVQKADLINQAQKAVDILKKAFPDYATKLKLIDEGSKIFGPSGTHGLTHAEYLDMVKVLKEKGYNITENNLVRFDIEGDGTISLHIEDLPFAIKEIEKQWPEKEGHTPAVKNESFGAKLGEGMHTVEQATENLATAREGLRKAKEKGKTAYGANYEPKIKAFENQVRYFEKELKAAKEYEEKQAKEAERLKNNPPKPPTPEQIKAEADKNAAKDQYRGQENKLRDKITELGYKLRDAQSIATGRVGYGKKKHEFTHSEVERASANKTLEETHAQLTPLKDALSELEEEKRKRDWKEETDKEAAGQLKYGEVSNQAQEFLKSTDPSDIKKIEAFKNDNGNILSGYLKQRLVEKMDDLKIEQFKKEGIPLSDGKKVVIGDTITSSKNPDFKAEIVDIKNGSWRKEVKIKTEGGDVVDMGLSEFQTQPYTKVESKVEQTKAALKKALDESLGNLGSGIDPLVAAKIIGLGAKYGAALIEAGFKDFKDWSKKMAEDFGEDIKAHLKDIWDKIQEKEPVSTEPPALTTEPEKISTEPPQSTSIKNAVSAEERINRGLNPVEAEYRQTDKEVFEKAKDRVDNGNYMDTVRAFEDDIKAGRRPVPNTEETMGINLQKIRTINEQIANNKAIKEAAANGDEVAMARARVTEARLKDERESIDYVARQLGSEQGASFRARRFVADLDYSLASLVGKAEAANQGKPISEKHMAELEDLAKLHEEKIKGLEAEIKQHEDYKAQIEEKERIAAQEEAMKKAKAEVEAEAKKAKQEEKYTKKKTNVSEGKSAVKAERRGILDDLAELSKQFGGKLNAGIDPSEIIAKSPLWYKLLKTYVKEGVLDIEDIALDIHKNVQDIFPDITPKQVMEYISGYGQQAKLSMEATAKQLRELRRQGRLISALTDAEEGQAPKRSGLQRDEPSPRVRELQRQIKVEMAKHPELNEVDQANRWKSALAGIKTRLRNGIDDLTKQIESGEKEPKNERVTEYDQEAKDLKAQRDALKVQFDEIFGKPELSDEQRVNLATKAIERSINELSRKIETGDIEPKATRKTPETPALKALRERRDKLTAKLAEMRGKKEPTDAQRIDRAAKSIQKSIDRLNKKIGTGDLSTERPESKTPASGLLDALKTQRDNLSDTLDEMRKNDEAFQQKVWMDRKSLRLKNLEEQEKDLQANGLKPKVEKTPLAMTSAMLSKEAEVKLVEKRVKDLINKLELENQTPLERNLSFAVRWGRAAKLGSATTIGKLAEYATEQLAGIPVEEVLGGGWSKILPGVAKKAGVEGGFSKNATAKLFAEFFAKQTWKDTLEMSKVWKENPGELELAYGKSHKGNVPGSVANWFGQLHAAIKNPIKRASFQFHLTKRTEVAIRNGADITDHCGQF